MWPRIGLNGGLKVQPVEFHFYLNVSEAPVGCIALLDFGQRRNLCGYCHGNISYVPKTRSCRAINQSQIDIIVINTLVGLVKYCKEL